MLRYLLCTLLLAGLVGLAAPTAHAQLRIGGGLIYGFDIEQLGLQANGFYQIQPNIEVGGDFTFYFPEEIGNITSRVFSINPTGHYIFFDDEESLRAYGLAGINIARFSVESDNQFFDDFSDTEFGLLLGAGGEYTLDFGRVFAELRFALEGEEQASLAAGIRFAIGD
ncbi:MAG: hypothetical protein AAGI71_11285 [Bacteroidota bacterium]